MRKSENLLAIINLSKLNGTVNLKHNNRQGIFIPLAENNIFSGAYGKFLKLYILDHKDKYGNDVIIARSLSPMEKRKKAQLVFLGHGKYETNEDKSNENHSQFIDPEDANPFV